MSQDEIVANFTTITTTDADEIAAAILAYNRTLSEALFDLSGLDDAHRQEIRLLAKTNLIRLRQRLESLLPAVRNATMAPDI